MSTRRGPSRPRCSQTLDEPGPPLNANVTGRAGSCSPSAPAVYAATNTSALAAAPVNLSSSPCSSTRSTSRPAVTVYRSSAPPALTECWVVTRSSAGSSPARPPSPAAPAPAPGAGASRRSSSGTRARIPAARCRPATGRLPPSSPGHENQLYASGPAGRAAHGGHRHGHGAGPGGAPVPVGGALVGVVHQPPARVRLLHPGGGNPVPWHRGPHHRRRRPVH